LGWETVADEREDPLSKNEIGGSDRSRGHRRRRRRQGVLSSSFFLSKAEVFSPDSASVGIYRMGFVAG
jgi:hypothetical protein